MIHPWERVEDKIGYDCGFFQVHVHQSVSPTTGKQHPFYVLSTRDWVNIVALTPEKKVLLVSQYRHGSGETSLEIPGGAVDAEDSSPEAAARRELLEETGYEAKEWYLIGQVQPNPAILDNTCYTYLALGATPAGPLNLDEGEELELLQADFADLPHLVQTGKIQHALVVAAFHFLDLFQKQNPSKF